MSESESIRGRVPPHSEEAERAVLGALLVDPQRAPDVAEMLRPSDFFNPRHRLIFEVFHDLITRNVAVDLLAISSALKASGKLGEVGGNTYVAQLTTQVSSAAHLVHHAGLVRNTGLLRELITTATDVIDESFTTQPDTDSVRELLDRSENSIYRINGTRDSSGAEVIGDIMVEAFKQLEQRSHKREMGGVPSGFYQLDEMLGGFNPGEMTVIAARPSMGKTAFALNLLDKAATTPIEGEDRQRVVLFFSLEMGATSIGHRMLCARARVDAHKLRTGKIPAEDYAELARAAGELERAKLFIDDTPGLSILALRSRARRIASNHGLDMIVIDYLQLMNAPKSESRQQEISLISRSLKELARDLEVPLLALSQLSRAVENRDKKRPQLSDLRESGAIEQDADVVLMLYREEYYEQTEENRNKAEIIIGKHRNGPTGAVPLNFRGNILRFENPEPSMVEAILP